MQVVSLDYIITDLETDLKAIANRELDDDTDDELNEIQIIINQLRTGTGMDNALRFYSYLIAAAKNAGLHSSKQRAELAKYIEIRETLKILAQPKALTTTP